MNPPTCAECGCSLVHCDSYQMVVPGGIVTGVGAYGGRLITKCVPCVRKQLGLPPDADTAFLTNIGIAR